MSRKLIFLDLGDTPVRTNPQTWIAGGKASLTDLKTEGFRLGIISNTGNIVIRTEIIGLLPTDFDLNVFKPALVLFSSEGGIARSDAAIFSMAVSLPGGPSENCL